MEILKAKTENLAEIKNLWTEIFDDGTEGFFDFISSVTAPEDFYIIREDGKTASMLIAVTDVEYKGKKGFYLYSACTAPEFRNRGFMNELVNFAVEDRKSQGKEFCVLQPANEGLFEFYKKMGFDNVIKIRKCNVRIKKNMWRKAEFDIVTASRFKSIREKFYKGKMLHYTNKSYEKYAQYLYTFGGSTAETENAYAVYYEENGNLIVTELLADSSYNAMYLLQAIRERTGCETATVYLADDTDIFLGEGKTENRYAVKGLSEDIYINLMFE